MADLLDLADRALELARQHFDEQVQTIVEASGDDPSDLALAAARLSTGGPAQGGSPDHIAFALLLEAAHRASQNHRDAGEFSRLAS